MEKVRKELHLPSQIAKDLKIAAALSDKSVKKYMEDVILYEVKTQMAKINRKLS